MVFLGLTGTLCSGKTTLAEYLQSHHGFKVARLKTLQDSQTAAEIAQSARETLTQLMDEWTADWVVLGFVHTEQVKIFRRRTFFYLMGLDGPLLLRFSLYKSKHSVPSLSLESFIATDDQSKYGGVGAGNSMQDCLALTDSCLINSGSLREFTEKLENIDLARVRKVRPTWDEYFMSLAQEASSRSNCLLRKSGSIIEMEHIVTGTGYTGTPFHVPNCYEPDGCAACHSNNEGSAECFCLHSELGAILDLSNRPVRNATLYCTDFPCLQCMKCIVQVKICRIVYLHDRPEYQKARELAQLAGVEAVPLHSL